MSSVESTATVESAHSMTASGKATCHRCAMITITWSNAISWPVTVSRTPIVTVPVAWTIEAATIVAVIPRPGTDEDAAYEIIRSVITIRGASIRIVAVITIRTRRRRPNACNHRADSNAHGNLSMSAACYGEK